MNKKQNSNNTKAANDIRNNQNALEILTKLDQALNSSESFLTVKTVDAQGKEIITQIPTIGFFQQKLDQLTNYVKKLAGIDGNPAVLQLANNSFKRIITADLSNEPKQIGNVNNITTFRTDPNWIFDSFLNPKISVEIDLSGKINEFTKTILSKRFIVKFDQIVTQSTDGGESIEYTTDGNLRRLEFFQKYKGNNDINMVEFVQWLDSPGLVNRVDSNLIDQDYFRIEPSRLQFKGAFDILATDIDTVNKKLWYILSDITYYDISDTTVQPKPIDLKIGDQITMSQKDDGTNSTTIYKVVEISTITSQFRVRFERVFGEEPIPVTLNSIQIYSNKIKSRTCKISVGFDEYCVLFLKQIDDTNNTVGLDFSSGTGFYTSELRLDNETGDFLSDYYIQKVYDYGAVLEDLVTKKTPNIFGEKPNAPILNIDNFKTVQINKHLTQTVEAEKIRDLHNQKNNISSQIIQIQTNIEKLNRQIQTTNFNSTADKKQAQDNLTKLSSNLINKTETRRSIVADILANKKNLNKIKPIFEVRGFFPFPSAVTSDKTKPQEVVQFEIWYRKLSTSGDENPILTIPDLNNESTQNASPLNTTNIANLSKPEKINATFSNWNKFRTDARKRVQDPISKDWFWQIEDVSDANTPNINQLALNIEIGERIEIKIKSLSEVGFPETPLESDYSNTITVDFPDDLNNILNEDEFILKEAQIDDLKVAVDRDLESRGLIAHLNTSIRDNDIYFAHRADAIASGFKDNNGKIINLYDKLLELSNNIIVLQDSINKTKGKLEVYIDIVGNRTKIFNGNNLSFNLNLEDYLTKTKIGLATNPVDSIDRTYKNELIKINRYSLIIKNGSQTSNLGVLSFRGYGQPNGLQPATFAYDGKAPTVDVNGNANLNRAIQAVFLTPAGEIITNNISSNGQLSAFPVPVTQAPVFATQKNNQFLWLKIKSVSGEYIYNSSLNQPNNGLFNNTTLVLGASHMHNIVTSTKYNVGLFSGTDQIIPTPASTDIINITDPKIWSINESNATITANGKFATTINPVIIDSNQLVDTSTQLVKIITPDDTDVITIPIPIFTKIYTGTGVFVNPGTNTQFDDTGYSPASSKHLPNISGKYRRSGSTTEIELDQSNVSIVTGDRILLSGFEDPIMLDANNKIFKVTSANMGSTVILIDYHKPAMSSTQLQDVGSSIGLFQLHKRYINNDLYAYTILGNIDFDHRPVVTNYVEIIGSASPSPTTHTKSVSFYMEDENNIRPFEFQFNFNITQYKPVLISNLANANNELSQ